MNDKLKEFSKTLMTVNEKSSRMVNEYQKNITNH